MINFEDKIHTFFSKSDNEILEYLMQWWEMESAIENNSIRLIGTYEKAEKPDKNGNEYGFFIDIRNPQGDILYYPFRLGKVRIFSTHKEYYNKKEFLQIKVSLSNQQFREKIKNPFILTLDSVLGNTSLKILDRIDKEKFIKTIFNETGFTLRDAKNTSNALKKIAGDLYTETERFIFELLQNADDIPNDKNEVDVKFKLLKENLLFLHNGKPFDNDDVNSIASIGDSTKHKDSEKTGYKGIGFKSVFTDAETVLIKSGNFSFSFDKHSPIYQGKTINEIPWEIKPIWTEYYRYPKEVKDCEDFFNYPVAIDLEVKEQKINNYKIQIQQLFSEPRFILFLRHIKTIEVQGLVNDVKIQKVIKNGRFELLNNDNPINEWAINDFEFSVSENIREEMEDDKVVPEKLKKITKSKLSFACQIIDDKIVKIEPDNSYLFTYLPTDVNAYKFPFLVNADFLTTANRQSIHVENIWNLYLFEQIGYLCFEWISSIALNEHLKYTISNLIPSRFDNSNESIHQHFNNGFDRAISNVEFLPTSNETICKASDAIVDLTGFSDIIGNNQFVNIIDSNKKLINNKVENKTNLKRLPDITFFGVVELKKIFEKSEFQQLLNPQLLLDILQFLQEKKYNFSDIGLLFSEQSNTNLYLPSSLYFQTNQETKSLLTFKSVIFLHPTINTFAESNNDFKNWLTDLGVKQFDGRTFISQKVINYASEINKKLSNKTINLDFWRFIFKYELLDSEINKLTPFFVFNTDNALVANVSSCYLSDFYKGITEPSVQQIALDLGLTSFNFISSDYCIKNDDKGKWRKLFYGAGLKHSQNVRILKDNIIPFIHNGKMDIINYLKITKFVFDVFNDNRSAFESNRMSNFKTLITTGTLLPLSDCILSNEYTQDSSLDNILPEFILPNQINDIYLQQISNNRQNWIDFFQSLNSNAKLNSLDIVKRKITIIANNPNTVTINNVQNIWNTIIIFKEELLKTNKEELQKIPILLKNGKIVSLSKISCYFPSEYNPITATETLLLGYHDYFISPLFLKLDSNLKSFFSFLGVLEKITFSIFSSNKWFYLVFHTEFLVNYQYSVKFWNYLIKYPSIITDVYFQQLRVTLKDNPAIPCLDGSVQPINKVHSFRLKELVNDNSVTSCIDFPENIELDLGIQQRLTVSKCFTVLNYIAQRNDVITRNIKQVYDDLLYRFTNENINSYLTEITNFKLNGKLLCNNNTFNPIVTLFNQDVSADYLPLEESERIIKRFGSKDDWIKFAIVLNTLGIQNITVSDFDLNSQSLKYDALELNKTLENSIPQFAKKIDTTNSQPIETNLLTNFSSLKIYYSPNLKLVCNKLNYSPIVPNYYDTLSNTIYYNGNWNSISNTKLISYLFKAFRITGNQISSDEFVSILLKNIPAKYEMPPTPPSIIPDGSTGRFGEELVYKELVNKFGKNRINWLNEGGESYREYDFEILNSKNEIIYFLDSKATTTDELSGESIPIYIRHSEWKFMQQCKDNYIIARVYNAKTSSAYVKYLKLGIQNLEEILL